MLWGYYRNPCPGVKPNYEGFSIQAADVINKIYNSEFIYNNFNGDLRVLKQTVFFPRDYP